MNFSFLAKSEFKGYAKKSFDLLDELVDAPSTSINLLPFIVSYRASALSLMSAETGKLKFLREAFELFEDAVKKYSRCVMHRNYERKRRRKSSVVFLFERKFAKCDFQSIIDKQEKNNDYTSSKIMSFAYWANQFEGKKFRKQALSYLDKAIELDPDYIAGRKRAEELKGKLLKR